MPKGDAARYDEILEAARGAGECRDEDDGRVAIGGVPGRPPGASLHVVYPPLEAEQIKEGEEQLERRIPGDYAKFLKKANGLIAFAESFQLLGLHLKSGGGQPPKLILPNVHERPDGATDAMFFFAFYDWDGSLLYLDEDDGRVYRTEREAVHPQGGWGSIADAAHSEFFRLAKLFEDGFDEAKRTVPE